MYLIAHAKGNPKDPQSSSSRMIIDRKFNQTSHAGEEGSDSADSSHLAQHLYIYQQDTIGPHKLQLVLFNLFINHV
jgi:hypothetical protein